MRRILKLALVVAALVLPARASPFKLKSHVITANRAREAILATGARALDLPMLGRIPVRNDEAMEAIERFPAYFRAGAVGPDGYPDLYAGQLWVHVNNGNPTNRGDCLQHPSECTDGGVPFEQRRLDQWRAIDYGMVLLDRAFNYRIGETGTARDERLQAIAFAYGYLSHMLADGASHGYVNEWTKAVFSYLEQNPGALYGPPTEEIQHMAVESYIDLHVQASDGELTVATPTAFLNSVLRAQLGTTDGLLRQEPAGAVGGIHYVKLIEARNLLAQLADSSRWPELAGRPGWNRELADVSLKFHDAAATVATFGTGIGDPVRDLEDLFERRRTMVDAVIDRWVDLSGCINQNLLLGSNKGPSAIVAVDACAAVDFETDPAVHAVFDGALNEAARYGHNQARFDFGRIGANIRKQEQFLRTVLTRGLWFSPTEDIRSIRLFKDAVADCDFRLVEWGSCDNACQTAHRTCTTYITKAICLTCPREHGNFDCGGWNFPVCMAQPHCFGCVTDAMEEVVDAACVAAVNSAVPVCEVCSVNSVCAHLQAARAVVDTLDLFPKMLIEQVVDPAMDEIKNKLLEVYAGPYANDLMRVYHEFERRRQRAKASWFINIAFLKEDLRSTEGVAHLNGIFRRILPVGENVVSGNTSLDAAIEETYRGTVDAAVSVLKQYVTATNDDTYRRIWRGLVAVLLRVARDAEFRPLLDFRGEAYAWLDEFGLGEESYETRFGRWVALLARVGGLLDVRGPTARLLRQSMHLNADPNDDATEPLDLNAFYPAANSIRLIELGFLGRDGIRELGTRAGLSFVSETVPFGFTPVAFEGEQSAAAPFSPSKICLRRPHIACDAIQSLDDPNHYGASLRVGSEIDRHETVDPNRSVSLWESLSNVYETPACALGVTNFLLAARVETVRKIYGRIFLYPDHCRVPHVIVEAIRHEPERPRPGAPVGLHIAMTNAGWQNAAPSVVTVVVRPHPPQRVPVPALVPGETRDVLARFELPEGIQTAIATLSSGGPEVRHVFEVRGVPDLVVHMSHVPPNPRPDTVVRFVVSVLNQGDSAAEPSTLRLNIHEAGPEYHDIPRLGPNQSTTVARDVKIGPRRRYTAIATIDPSNVVPEDNEANNVAGDTLRFHSHGSASASFVAAGTLLLEVDCEGWFRDDKLVLRGGAAANQSGSVFVFPITLSRLFMWRLVTADLALELGGGGLLSRTSKPVSFDPFGGGWTASAAGIVGVRYVGTTGMLRFAYMPVIGAGGYGGMWVLGGGGLF